MVWVQEQPFVCVRAGQLLNVNVRFNGWVYSGALVCPACTDFCSSCPLPHQLPQINNTQVAKIGESPVSVLHK